jgi:hypothetical protein
MSLLGEAIGFSIFGILIIMNRHQADLNGLADGSSVATVRRDQRASSEHGFLCRLESKRDPNAPKE